MEKQSFPFQTHAPGRSPPENVCEIHICYFIIKSLNSKVSYGFFKRSLSCCAGTVQDLVFSMTSGFQFCSVNMPELIGFPHLSLLVCHYATTCTWGRDHHCTEQRSSSQPCPVFLPLLLTVVFFKRSNTYCK